jgi:hypothetical protein
VTRLLIAVVLLLPATAFAAGGDTMQLGRGLGPYRLGMQRVEHPGLIRTVRQQQNDAGGCSGAFQLDSYIDVYPGLRLGYVLGTGRKAYLDVISTTRAGDRTSLGYAIGRSTLSDVRRRYPHLRLRRHLGGSTLTVVHRTGYESGENLTYSFNAADRLAGLSTSVGGC